MAAPTIAAADAVTLVAVLREVLRTGVVTKLKGWHLERLLAICTECSSANKSATLTDVAYDDALDGRPFATGI